MTLMHRLFFSQASLFYNREKEKLATYRCYNSNSELHALYVLQCIVDDIAQKIKQIVPEGEKIATIEFHGCTFRDMCPLCYTNMNCMQFLANEKKDNGILGALLERLKTMKYVDDSTNSATIISSLEAFPSKNFGGNLLWDIDELAQEIVPGFVYQFRFTDDEINEIKTSSEKTLKEKANIVDLSSLPTGSGAGVSSSAAAGVTPFLGSPIIETPPSTTEKQETISSELATAGYHLQDVPGDGNCAFWAVLVQREMSHRTNWAN